MKKEAVLKAFANRLRAERLKRGLSQEKLAELANVHRNYIGMLERAERNPSLIHFKKIAKALKVKVGSLVEG
ncbi:MAG: helix-turn-helix transcriptional regulator [candidate division FCPU426 bacterium]